MTATFARARLGRFADDRVELGGYLQAADLFFGAHAILNFGLAVLLAKPFGAVGVAWATPIASLLTSAGGTRG